MPKILLVEFRNEQLSYYLWIQFVVVDLAKNVS